MDDQAVLALTGELDQLSADLASLERVDGGFRIPPEELAIMNGRIASLRGVIARLRGVVVERRLIPGE